METADYAGASVLAALHGPPALRSGQLEPEQLYAWLAWLESAARFRAEREAALRDKQAALVGELVAVIAGACPDEWTDPA
jgi:hypothetical protein